MYRVLLHLLKNRRNATEVHVVADNINLLLQRRCDILQLSKTKNVHSFRIQILFIGVLQRLYFGGEVRNLSLHPQRRGVAIILILCFHRRHVGRVRGSWRW